MFNPHSNKTADGAVIVPQMYVFTNEMEVGRVVKDRTSGPCCEKPGNAQVYMGGYFTDHQFSCPSGGECYCRHNHWYDVEYVNGGTVMMDGERLATKFQGRSAEDVYKSQLPDLPEEKWGSEARSVDNVQDKLADISRYVSDALNALEDEHEGNFKTAINMLADDASSLRDAVNQW
jgi:hypothetical protein